MKQPTKDLIAEYNMRVKSPDFSRKGIAERQTIARELHHRGVVLDLKTYKADTLGMEDNTKNDTEESKNSMPKKRTLQSDKKTEPRRHTTIRFDPKIWRKAKAKAALEGKTLTDVIRRCLTDYVNSKTEPPEEKD
jgi:predicted HicB family RNase H-like nuclease